MMRWLTGTLMNDVIGPLNIVSARPGVLVTQDWVMLISRSRRPGVYRLQLISLQQPIWHQIASNHTSKWSWVTHTYFLNFSAVVFAWFFAVTSTNLAASTSACKANRCRSGSIIQSCIMVISSKLFASCFSQYSLRTTCSIESLDIYEETSSAINFDCWAALSSKSCITRILDQ